MSAALSAMTPANMASPISPQTKIQSAAKQFEALMIAQMLRTERENAEDGDSSSSTMLDVADQQFSQMLANNGGLGIAKLIEKGLTNANQQHSSNQ